VQVRHTQRARRAHSITALEKYRGDLIDDIQHVIGEREEARAQAAKLSAELWERKPLEDRVASLADELAQARAENQHFLKTIAENADQFSEHTAALVQERDEAREERDKLKGLIDDLLDEPTARQVQDMLRTWITAVDWLAGCFDSAGREQIDTIQKTLISVMERIDMFNPEVNTDGE
jgi:phage shock protein A